MTQIACPIEEALARKYPEPVVLVTTRDHDGRANVMAAAWVCFASSEPWMFLLGIDAGARTYEVIVRTRQFVVAFPHEGMGRETLYAGTNHGHATDKFKETGLAMQDASVVRAPLVRDAVANFECELVEIYQPGDCPLIAGKVVAAHANRDADLRRLCLVGPDYRLGGLRPA
ncbi:MAG TPA: flavin reductase family protein [Kiritimatiellia bacterium]|nr:flavin reductase family protein [Kiritimatiellia bacterium]HRZ11216.1 flavin reductase family protein [Kiritimatiellia bacterium]HSA19067.1 flavin reductase family protein [Kiritimatiellia bacterium]